MKNIKYTLVLLVGFMACQPKDGSKEQKIARLEEIKKEIHELKEEKRNLQDELFSDDDAKKNYTSVQVSEIKLSNFNSFFEAHAVVETNKNIQVVPEMQGTIVKIHVTEGQKVKKGDRLATLDTEIVQKQVQEVKKALELAVDIFEKQTKLKENNIGTDVEFKQAKNQKERLEKNLSTLQSQLGKAIIQAPINGTVDEIFSNEGEMASPAMPFARIIDISDIYVNADVSETYLGKIKPGNSVKVTFPSLGMDSVIAKVSFVGTYIKPMNRTFPIHVDLTNKDNRYLPNLLSVIKVANESIENVVIVHSKNVLNDGKHSYVYVIGKNEMGQTITEKREVTTGSTYEGNVVITSGLKEGDKIVTKGQTIVSNGTIVEVL